MALKQAELLKNPSCLIHVKEFLRYFCNTCEIPICAECIFDHSGHAFVRWEESFHIVRENADSIWKVIEDSLEETNKKILTAENALSFLEKQKES